MTFLIITAMDRIASHEPIFKNIVNIAKVDKFIFTSKGIIPENVPARSRG